MKLPTRGGTCACCPVRNAAVTPLKVLRPSLCFVNGYSRTDLDALAALRAVVEHVVDATLESRLERGVIHRLQT